MMFIKAKNTFPQKYNGAKSMNSPCFRLPNRSSRRAGFTIVELMVVIAIIGVLVGILAVAVGPAIWRTDEHVISSEIVQLEAAIEKFKEKYGFYPPDFTAITGPDDMAPYLNKISRNHAEFSAFPVGHPLAGSYTRRIDAWWDHYGNHIRTGDRAGALVFWLSHLFNNAQYPLTAGLDVSERQVFFEFDNGRLYEIQAGLSEPMASPTYRLPGVYGFVQAKGPELPYVYFHHQTYALSGYASPVVPGTGSVTPYIDPSASPPNYYNPNTFQIIAAGLDGLYGVGDGQMVNNPTYVADKDNLTNFAEGRNDKLLN
jgi:prepilin-type N-terminal cleavage/methylation domain-containing protein